MVGGEVVGGRGTGVVWHGTGMCRAFSLMWSRLLVSGLMLCFSTVPWPSVSIIYVTMGQ